jgi:hypothetical protein
MDKRTAKIVNVEEDARTKEILQQVNDLRAANTELRKQTKNKGLPTNVRDDLFATIDENTELIEELLRDLNKPTIVPITEAPIVANHKYEEHSSYSRNSVRF